MNKYTSELTKKIIASKILKRCREISRHDVRVAFGYDSSSYDLKKDLYVYMPNDKSYFIGKYKELCFECKEDRLFCFKPLAHDENLMGAFVARINNKLEIEGKIEGICYPKVSGKGEYLVNMYNKIIKMADKEKIIEMEEKKKNPRK